MGLIGEENKSGHAAESNKPLSPIVGTSEMAAAIRAFDWAKTPLGPLNGWSETFLSIVNLLVSSPLPATLSWGPDLTFLYNDAAIPTIGPTHPGALGRQYREVFREAWFRVSADFEACLRQGKISVRENVLIPLLRGGITSERFWNYSLVPVYERGQIVAVYNVFQETTSNLMALRDREAAALLLVQALEATTDGVFSLDRDWKFTYLNGKARTMLAASGELVGRDYWEAYPENNHKGSIFYDNYHLAMDDGVPSDFEGYYPEPYESWFHAIVRPTAQGITVFFRDVTTSRKATAALIQSEKLTAMGRLAASIAHEVNNPLESVTNLIYLARTSETFEAAREYLDSADRELRRASGITNQTLRFHKQSTNPTEITAEDLVRGVMAIHQGRVMNSGVQVQERLRAVCPVLCFEGEIQQVLSNLVGNATDAMQTCPRTLFVRSRDGHDWKTGRLGLILTVADTGTGMSRQTLQKAFEPFYTTKGVEGTGLGLWVSKEIADRHRGALNVRSSNGPNHHGTVFTLFLPHDAAKRSVSE